MDKACFEIVGNVGNGAIKSVIGGKKIVIVSVATSERWKTIAGEWREKTYWHHVAVLEAAKIERIEGILQKGSRVRIIGQIRPAPYEENAGRTKYLVELVVGPAGSVEILVPNKVKTDST